MKPSKRRPSRQPTAEEYERAIQRAEQTFSRNKARLWVLIILREYIEQEVDRIRYSAT